LWGLFVLTQAAWLGASGMVPRICEFKLGGEGTTRGTGHSKQVVSSGAVTTGIPITVTVPVAQKYIPRFGGAAERPYLLGYYWV